MGDFNSIGKTIMVFGAILLGIGFFITFAGRFFPLGKLPGDIFIRKGNFTFYFPLVTSIILSIVLTILINFFGRK
ncbi:MAG: DUF2905 domain-containing protein [Firmicutes bacterium HGW-Firmicutes-14]|jgi:hypothetical protein|nr:MAG: DUF2905 domain-containing protein [Firmicutes bacterium HGW-Firmicutes-14]